MFHGSLEEPRNKLWFRIQEEGLLGEVELAWIAESRNPVNVKKNERSAFQIVVSKIKKGKSLHY